MRTEAFYAFVNERESIRLRKEADLLARAQGEIPQGPPWTEDPILREYKFTNVRRYHDRTSRELREKFYDLNFNDDRKSILMNCALFRYFGTIEFAEAVGWQSYESFDFERIKETASDRLANGERVFTGAYVITNQGISAPKQEVVVDHFLKGLHANTPAIVDHASKSDSWKEVALLMREVPGFGGTGFMTKEVLLDTMYCDFWDWRFDTENDGVFTTPRDYLSWTPIGPGARRGAARVLGVDPNSIGEKKAFGVIMSLYNLQDDYYEFANEKDEPKLAPTDIQFQLCEFDKYERVRLGEGRPRSKYRPR